MTGSAIALFVLSPQTVIDDSEKARRHNSLR